MSGDGDERGSAAPAVPAVAAPDDGGEREERKERILHTRVPDSLDRHIKRRARSLGMSVSTVVRHVLLNTFGLVEDIVTDSTNMALSLAGQDAEPQRAPASRPSPEERTTSADDDVLGWQEVVLNRNAVCDRCNAVLRKGGRAAVAIRDGSGPRPILCGRCLAGVARPHEPRHRGRRRGR